ncbi:GntR family transcriptional regulator [Agarilytica rhodophyticola]|uniref:GntR family transcriptional regulator n=1 Tax=Agarilytica rhodophyticola TaxID=1737490 RepID=UPI001FE9AA70|nr:GntR family transcriptional regulator [Agarilytica rhodophyticola]
MMHSEWKDGEPIYRQLKSKVISLILNGTYQEEAALPSVREVSSDLNINHLTVSKAYQQLVAEGLLEKKRGLGMFVIAGAKNIIMEKEKEKFFNSELPEFILRIKELGISTSDVVEKLKQ